MIPALIAAAVFAIGVVYNVSRGDAPNAWLGLLIAGLLIVAHVVARRAQADRLELLRWLLEHEREIRTGGKRLDHVMVTPSTLVHEMTLCVSVIWVTMRTPSKLLLEGRDSVLTSGLGLSVLTLLLGWWGVPWGPLYSLQALGRNVTGGKRYTVEALLDQMHAA